MRLVRIILLIFCRLGYSTSHSPKDTCSYRKEENTVSLNGNCTVVQALLPEEPSTIYLDNEAFHYNKGIFTSRLDNWQTIEFSQETYGPKYRVKAKYCSPRTYFSIAWKMDKFESAQGFARITQFFDPEGHSSTRNHHCIQPEYSLPLLRYSNGSSTVNVDCAIRLSMCHNTEHIEIYDQKKMLCEYTTQNKTCGRRIVNKDTIVYSVNVEKDVTKKYDPDQYVFCAWHRGSVSIQIVWGYHPSLLCSGQTSGSEAMEAKDRPSLLRADVYSSRAIRVVFEEPIIRDVKFDDFRLNISGDFQKSQLIGVTNGVVLLDSLKPSTTYKLSLEAKYAGTEIFSKPRWTTATTFAEGTDKPKNLKAEAISATSLKVTWDAPVNVHLDSTRYLLEVGEVRKEFPYNDFNGTYTIDGLTPGQKYKVLVRLSLQNPHYLAPAAEIDVET